MLTPITSGRYISIKADGKLHEKVSKETEGAVLREYELKDGTKGEKWELLYSKVEGYITEVKFEDGDFGENLLITLKDGEDEIVLAQGVSTAFGEDMLKKLPALNFAEKVTIAPYAFEDERGRVKNGVTFYQNSDKVASFFWDGEKNLHGFPAIDKKEDEDWSKDEWKAHFLKVRIFLTKYAKENVVSKFAEGAEEIKRPTDEEEQRKLAEAIPF